MRALVWLVIGMIVGIGIGWLLGQESGLPSRSERAEIQWGPRAVFRSEPSRTPSKPQAPPDDSVPRELRGEREDDPLSIRADSLGTLIIEYDGTRVDADSVTVYPIDMLGEEQEASWDEDESNATRAVYRLWPGEASVVWYDEESTRRVKVTIKADETIVVNTGAPPRAEDGPIPQGRGRLIVSIHGVDGEPITDGSFELFGRGASGVMEESLEVDGTGRIALDLRPGPYRVVVGAQSHDSTLVAGSTTRVDFRSGNEGEVEFRGPGSGGCWLRFPGAAKDAERPRFVFHAGRAGWRLLYVRPGTYEFFFQGYGESRPRNLGLVQVSAGTRTKVHGDLPGGSVHVRLLGLGTKPVFTNAVLEPLDSNEAPGRIRRSPSQEPKPTESAAEYPCSVVFDHLPAGRWRFDFRPPGFQPVTRTIDVADKPIELTIEMRRE